MSVIEEVIVNNREARGQLSALYGLFTKAGRYDLKVDVTEDEWGSSCLKAQMQTINTALRLVQCKWLLRTQ